MFLLDCSAVISLLNLDDVADFLLRDLELSKYGMDIDKTALILAEIIRKTPKIGFLF